MSPAGVSSLNSIPASSVTGPIATVNEISSPGKASVLSDVIMIDAFAAA